MSHHTTHMIRFIHNLVKSIFSDKQDDESSQELTVIDEEPIKDHFSEPEILERPESRLGSRQPDVQELSFGKPEQRIREQFKEHQIERTESIEVRTEIKDIPISEKLMMMHREEQNRTTVSTEEFDDIDVPFSSSGPFTDEDRLAEIIARHSDNHSRKKSDESQGKGDCGAPIISDSESEASNINDENVLTIASGEASEEMYEHGVADEIHVMNGVSRNHEIESKDDIRASMSQYEQIRLCSFAELLGEYNWSIPYALYKV